MTPDRQVDRASLRSAGPRLLGARPRSLSAPGDALLDRDPSRSLQARHQRVRPLLRHADRRRSRWRYVNGFAYKIVRPVAGRRDPRALPARRGGLPAEALARAASRLGRDVQAGLDARLTASCRRSIPTRSPTTTSPRISTRCRDHHAEMLYQHMRFTARRVVPTGDFLAHVGDWTGLPPAELLGLMRGASPVSAGASDELGAADRRDPAGPARAEAARRPTTIPARCSQRCARSIGGTGAAVSGYLDLVGYRLLDGFDISNPTRSSCRTRCCRAIRIAVAGDGAETLGRRSADRRRPRARCPRSTGPSSTSCSARPG